MDAAAATANNIGGRQRRLIVMIHSLSVDTP
jgi:hypothetical protein